MAGGMDSFVGPGGVIAGGGAELIAVGEQDAISCNVIGCVRSAMATGNRPAVEDLFSPLQTLGSGRSLGCIGCPSLFQEGWQCIASQIRDVKHGNSAKDCPLSGTVTGSFGGVVLIVEDNRFENDDCFTTAPRHQPMASRFNVATPIGFGCRPLDLAKGEQQGITATVRPTSEEVDMLGLALNPGSAPGGGAPLEQGDQVGDEGLGRGCSRGSQGNQAGDRT